MSRAAKIYDFALPANGARELLVEGSYYRILSSTGAVEVRRNGGSALGPIYAGQGERAEFNRLTLVDKSGASNIGLVIVADDTFIDDRITGEVTVIDANAKTTLANRAFSGNTASLALAGNYSHTQVFNSDPSRNVFVRSMSVTVTVAAGVAYGLRNSSLATAGALINSKKAGGAQSVARFYTEQNVADLVAVPLGYFLSDGLRSLFIEFREPVLLTQGWGLVVRPSNVNTQITAQYEIVEESST